MGTVQRMKEIAPGPVVQRLLIAQEKARVNCEPIQPGPTSKES
jgi:hypothetical protein